MDKQAASSHPQSLQNVDVQRPSTPRTPLGAMAQTRRHLLLTVASAVVIAAVAAIATFQLRSPASAVSIDAAWSAQRNLASNEQALVNSEDEFHQEMDQMMRQMATATQFNADVTSNGDTFAGDQYAILFLKFISHYSKKYNLNEFASRLKLFKESVDLVYSTNTRPGTPYTLTVNDFADLTQNETEQRLGLRPISDAELAAFNEIPLSEVTGAEVQALPATVDWRTMNVVTPVLNQGACGSCWTWGAAQAIESMTALAGGPLQVLSKQQMLDCVPTSNYGCNGGFPHVALAWVQSNGGLGSEAAYPYQAKQGTCRRVPSVARISGFRRLPKNDEASLLAAVAIQPVIVCLYASDRGWTLYKSGVFTGACGTTPNHAVMAIGYGVENGIPYWLIKNSWGPGYGNGGYMKMRRNLGGIGMCGITTMSSYPTSFSPLRAYGSGVPRPTATPTGRPTAAPTVAPTIRPTAAPTVAPSVRPTAAPTPPPSGASCASGATGIVCYPSNCCPSFRMCSNGLAYPQQPTAPGTLCYDGQIIFQSDPRCATMSC